MIAGRIAGFSCGWERMFAASDEGSIHAFGHMNGAPLDDAPEAIGSDPPPRRDPGPRFLAASLTLGDEALV
jgi:hypothetical protein